MSPALAAALQVAALVVALAAAWRPLGDYLARTLTSERHTRVERALYRAGGIDAGADQRWPVYLRSVLAFSLVSMVVLYAILRLQAYLPYSLGREGMPSLQALNTAVSFVTNTNWQSYSGEQALGYTAQAAGLAVQNFLSSAVGIAVAVALVRGFTRTRTDRIGSFWVDLTRIVLRVLLPLAAVAAVVLLLGGVVQNLAGDTTITTLGGGTQTLPGGPVASQEAIKELGTNGGGFYNANSAHPFENPTGFTNLVEIFLILLIPFSLTRTFGRLVGDVRQGVAILGVMSGLFAVMTAITVWAEIQHAGPALQLAGAAMEGKEVRFGVPISAVFASATTGTSTGAVDSMHSSFTAYGGGAVIVNMLFGEVAPGGVGSGLYGMLIAAIVAVFVAGLMVGRTPEYLGKKIQAREMKLVSLYILTTPALVLLGLGAAMATETGRSSILNPGAHGLSEVLYAFASASNNNGSAFAGLSANTDFYNVALAVAMALGRFLPICFVLALAGSLAAQSVTPATAGTLPTHRPLFAGLVAGVVVIVAALTFVPALALGPLAEGLS
ncbi:MAG: potassium-transporting ATPase subunit KdpA [Actinobacteria bacterium]|jgi:K+-transporting ATPase ATPase A chain|nr:potassium-transporting ATPase subunit KdpA [Actinomycetota bacterium]